MNNFKEEFRKSIATVKIEKAKKEKRDVYLQEKRRREQIEERNESRETLINYVNKIFSDYKETLLDYSLNTFLSMAKKSLLPPYEVEYLFARDFFECSIFSKDLPPILEGLIHTGLQSKLSDLLICSLNVSVKTRNAAYSFKRVGKMLVDDDLKVEIIINISIDF